MFISRRAGLGAGLMLALGLCSAAAQDITAGPLIVRQAWTRATPGGADVAGGYLTVINTGSEPDRLVGGSLTAATGFGLHEMSTDGGVMKMRPTGPLVIQPGGTLSLTPSGLHIMFTGLKHGLRRGDSVEGTLVFDHAGTVPVRFAVESIGAKGPGTGDPGGDGATPPAMPGMKMP